jgi:hypothetical protein
MLATLLRIVVFVFKSRRALVLENLAIRHQISVLRRSSRHRPRFSRLDRCLWVLISRFWSGWRESLVIVKPETVVRWHRAGFRLYWRRKSRVRGRPRKPHDVRALVRRMARENPLWGAPRIHGELLKLGIDVAQATVSSFLGRPRKPPSQTWRTFLKNHANEIASIDFFTVPTATFKVLYMFLVLSHERRRVVHPEGVEIPVRKDGLLWRGEEPPGASQPLPGPTFPHGEYGRDYPRDYLAATRYLDRLSALFQLPEDLQAASLEGCHGNGHLGILTGHHTWSRTERTEPGVGARHHSAIGLGSADLIVYLTAAYAVR